MTTPATSLLDAQGEACGSVTPLIRKALSALQAGEVLEVLTHDPATRAGVPAWCRLTGHELMDSRNDGQRTRFWIRKKPDPHPPA
jgi:tRNA 2-thiouridine synthesizing protein A